MALIAIWTIVFDLFFRREPLNEAHDSTFGILENYHCWRFHGSGVITALSILGLIFFCTGMRHEYFFYVFNVRSCSPFIFENAENIQLIAGLWCTQCVLPQWFRHEDSGWILTLKLVWKCVTRSSILFICNTVCCWLILLSSLYIELALVCCTNPDNVNCFGTIFPNLNLVFA